MAITQVQTIVYASGTTSATASYVNTPTEGNLLIAYAGHGAETMAGASISGFTLVVSAKTNTSRCVGIYYKIAGAAESKNVVLTGTNPCRIAIEEWSGLTLATPDASASTADTGSSVTSRSSGTTGTTVAVEELAVAVVPPSGPTASQTWSNSFTQTYGTSNFFTAYRLLSVTGSCETTLSWTTAKQAGGMIATFRAGQALRANYLHARRDRMNTKGVSKQNSLA